MVYNKTKRTLELIAGIFGIAGSIGTVIASLYLFIINVIVVSAVGSNASSIVTMIFMALWLGVSICALIFSCMVIKSPVRPEGILRTTKRRICLLVFSFLTGNMVTFGLELAVVLLKDFVDENQPKPQKNNIYIQMPQQANAPVTTSTTQANVQSTNESVEAKVAELKHLKELGVIDEDAYNKAITKIVENLK